MSDLHQLLHDYDQFHRNPINRGLHALGIPLILASGVGLLYALPSITLLEHPLAPVWLAVILLVREMGRWSWPIAAGWTALLLAVAGLSQWTQQMGLSTGLLAVISGAAFVAGWGCQFLGHAFEGIAPRFTQRPEFLAAGPLSLGAALCRRLGIPY